MFSMNPGSGSKAGTRRALALAAGCLIAANIGGMPLAKGDDRTALPWTGPAASAKPVARAVFAGNDIHGRRGLWVTDATFAGTSELAVRGAYPAGLLILTDDGDAGFTRLGGKLLFVGASKAEAGLPAPADLWVTNGTATGTASLKVAGANSSGLFSGGLDPHFTVLGKKAIFAGEDSIGRPDPWVTDGTSSGTHEIKVTGATVDGLFDFGDPGFTILGNKAIFGGSTANSSAALWMTDGSSAGTKELKVAGLSSLIAGLSITKPYFVVLDRKALFAGENRAGRVGLWSTDGTAAGTKELVARDIFHGVLNPGFKRLGTKVLFAGTALAAGGGFFTTNLWVTNGTAAGTRELPVSGASSLGLLEFGNPDTEFLVLRKKALFKGEDASGRSSLWVTDGTAAGTRELSVAGAWSGGLFNSDFNPGFTALAGTVLFLGSDAGGNPNLWVTDGTSAGTREIKVFGAYWQGLTPQGFAVVGNRELFNGLDASGRAQLWVTDGTSAGTKRLTVRGLPPDLALNPSDITPFVAPPTPTPDSLALERGPGGSSD